MRVLNLRVREEGNLIHALLTELRGTCHEGWANFKIMCNKYIMYCKVQVGKDSEEDVFWL